MIDTVIFDLDGTLIDSQLAALGGAIEALARFGVHVTEAELREQFGGGSRKIMQYFLERDLSLDDAAQVVDEATDLKINLQASFDHKVVDGAVGGEFMKELKKVIENPLELML